MSRVNKITFNGNDEDFDKEVLELQRKITASWDEIIESLRYQ